MVEHTTCYRFLQGRIENDPHYYSLGRSFGSSMLESLNYIALSYLGHVWIFPLVCHTIIAASQKYRERFVHQRFGKHTLTDSITGLHPLLT